MESPKSQNTPQNAKRTTYTVRCSNCGYRNPPNHQFCVLCGQALSHPGLDVTPNALGDESDSLLTQPAGPVKRLPVPTPTRSFLVWAGVVGGILILGAIALAAVVFDEMPLRLRLPIAATPTPQGLATFLIGSWEYQSVDGWYSFIEFTPDGTFIGLAESGTYEVVSEYTILINKVGYGESALRVQDFQGDTITIGEPGAPARTYQRLSSVPHLAEAIIGFWADTGENGKVAMEFTTNGTVLAYGLGYDLIGNYKTVSSNSLEVYNTIYPKHSEEKYFIRFIGASHDTLTLYLGPGAIYELTRVEEIHDLAKLIVGVWQVQPPGTVVEFTADGHIINPDGSVAEYEVISNNTVILKGSEIIPLNIIYLSNDSVGVVSWGEVYTEVDQHDVWTRVNP